MSDEQDAAAKIAPSSLPVTWKDGHSGKTYGGRPVQVATAAEADRFGDPRAQTCTMCRHFRLEDGQAAMKKQRFLERIVIDEGWKAKYLGAPPETYGFCRESDALTNMYSPSCSHFTPRRGLMVVR